MALSTSLAKELALHVEGLVLNNEPMWRHTTWRIGGPAEVMLIPRGVQDVLVAQEWARAKGLRVTVLGNGSNILIADAGLPGLVIITRGSLNQVIIDGNIVMCESGTMLSHLAEAAAKAGLTGLEFSPGIPATVGGAVIMNAGANGKSMGAMVQAVTLLTSAGQTLELDKEMITWGYRLSSLRGRGTVLRVEFSPLSKGVEEEIRLRMKQNLERKKRSQPLNLPSAGSVFLNPPDVTAGHLLELSGAKGLNIGAAQVSTLHANFIVNLGGATAADVLELIKILRNMVWESFGLELQVEVEYLA